MMSVLPMALRNSGKERTAQLVCLGFASIQLLASDRCEKYLLLLFSSSHLLVFLFPSFFILPSSLLLLFFFFFFFFFFFSL